MSSDAHLSSPRGRARPSELVGRVIGRGTRGDHPALQRFDASPKQGHDWPELAAICARIHAALDIGIAVQPDRPFLMHAQRLRELTVAEQ